VARLDRLATVKALAQLGATLGRDFSYELLLAVSPWDAGTLQRGLHQLVEAEFLYQQGLPPQATYVFKHALIQEAAYQSLLRSTRQRHHQHIAQVLEAQFPELCETQPELLAHHYTEAGLIAQAIPYWQQAGQRAVQRFAHREAIGHLTKGLELLKGLPDTPEHTRQELDLQTALGSACMAAKGYAAPEVEQAYGWARELCRQLGETSRLFSVLRGLGAFYFVRGKYQTAREVGEELLSLAQSPHDPTRLLGAHQVLGIAAFWLGELASARGHLEQTIALYDPQQHRARGFRSGQDPGVLCRAYNAWALGLLGYPDQALERIHEAVTLGRDLSHPHSLVFALYLVVSLHQLRRDVPATHEWAEATLALSREQLFPYWLAVGRITRGWALAYHGQGMEGTEEIRQGLAAYQATGAELGRPWFLALLAEACGKAGQAEEGLHVVAEALTAAANIGEGFFEAERYRLKGELLLACSLEHQTVAESCLHQAIDSARRQQAKWLELRAAVSLSRLWQHQGKHANARELLTPLYGWFTEGFDTTDLREASTLLEELT
jgi:predicted ATPase